MLTGSRNKLDDLTALDLVATVDLSDQRTGERVLRLADKAQISLPQGVKVDGYQPSAIQIRLEPILERQIAVEPKLEGKPADGYEVYAVRPNKGSVTVRGPESRVNALQKVMTESIWVSGHKETFTAQNVAIDLSDAKVDLLEPVVNVEVEIGEKLVEKSFSNVAVSSLDGKIGRMAITVAGPPSILNTLKAEDLKIVLESGGEPRLQLSPELQGKVTLRSRKSAPER
jgi:YbbR domain-containing protein